MWPIRGTLLAYPAKQRADRRRLSRRSVITAIGAAALPLTFAASRARASGNAPSNTLLVAGPAGGRMAQWANLLSPLLGPALAGGGILNLITVGAADGVTAANQFVTEVSPDGDTAMLLPGSAAIAQLVGDPRARFDPGAWVAGLAGISSTMVMARAPLEQFATKVPLRVLAEDPIGSDLPTLLGLTLLGYTVTAVTLTGSSSVADAASRGEIDVATVSNAGPGDVAKWQNAGLAPLFSLGAIDGTGAWIPDPSLPMLPTLVTLMAARGVDPTHPLPAAWRALTVAKQLTLGLVLPQLTPADRVAQWRQACAASIASIAIQAIAATESLRLTTQPTAAAIIASITAPPDAQLELHQWLANRLGWRPS